MQYAGNISQDVLWLMKVRLFIRCIKTEDCMGLFRMVTIGFTTINKEPERLAGAAKLHTCGFWKTETGSFPVIKF